MPTNTRSKRVQRSQVPSEFRSGSATRTTPAPVGEFVPFTTPGYITEPQWNFICDLLDKRDLLKSVRFFDAVNAMDQEEYAAYIEKLKVQLRRVHRARASEVIDALKALPWKKKEAAPTTDRKVPQVPAGRYALRYPQDELNPIRFYKVRHGKDNTEHGGKDWRGAIFVERFASDDTFPVKYRSAEYFRVLGEIAANPLAAGQLYGEEFGRCCVCNRGLTRRISRAMHVGPVCLAKHGDVWGLDPETYIEETRQALIEEGLDPDENLPESHHG